jgi:4-diphosphocytidyl-2-C-methyl-D-erythritol kinase
LQAQAQAPQALEARAWAKVNLALDIVGKRPDGYHDIETVMHRIELADDIEVVRDKDPVSAGEPVITVEVTGVAGLDVSGVPCGRGNIAFRAAQAFLARLGFRGASVSIRIRKRIPVGAGLGGGSADAAAVLVAMNRLWENPLGREQLMAVGASIGADVPFCLANNDAAFAQGIGDRLTPLPGLLGVGLLLVNPGYAVSTSDAYAKWDARHTRDGGAPARALARAIAAGRAEGDGGPDLRRICALLSNDFEPLVAEEHGQVLHLKQLLMQAGAIGALMSGSGPTVFGVYDSPGQAEAAAVVFGSRADSHIRVIPSCTCTGARES